MRLTQLLFATLVLMIGATASFACLCMNFDTVCEAYENSEAIIVGKVISFRKVTNPGVANAFNSGQFAVLSITKAYKGDLKNSIEIWQPASSCDYQFQKKDIGRSFLLYLHRFNDPNRLTPIACGQSRRVMGGEGEISWLDNLPSSLGRSFFYGSLREYEYDEDDWPRFKAMVPNTEIELVGKKRTIHRSTNRNGFFEFWDLPIDTYKLRIHTDKRFRVDDEFIRGFWDKEPEDETKFDPLNDGLFEVDGEGCQEVVYDLMKGEKR